MGKVVALEASGGSQLLPVFFQGNMILMRVNLVDNQQLKHYSIKDLGLKWVW